MEHQDHWVPLAPLETPVPSEALERLDQVARTVDLERGARLELRELVDREEKQEHGVCLERGVSMECLDYLVKLARLVPLVTQGHVVPQVQGVDRESQVHLVPLVPEESAGLMEFLDSRGVTVKQVQMEEMEHQDHQAFQERGVHLVFRGLRGDPGQWGQMVHQDPRGAGESQEVRDPPVTKVALEILVTQETQAQMEHKEILVYLDQQESLAGQDFQEGLEHQVHKEKQVYKDPLGPLEEEVMMEEEEKLD